MAEIAAASAVFKLLLALLGIVGARASLIWFDKYMVPPAFKEWLNNAEDSARAMYYGLRFLGVCLLVGFAVG